MSVDIQNMDIFYCDDLEKKTNNFNFEELISKIDNIELNDNVAFPHIINYRENYTVKELLLICEYYGFAKYLKANKYNKEQIVNWLVVFENDINNSDIVFKRQDMWFYINELKKDKFMKKYVVW
jgi:hypothetical protein